MLNRASMRYAMAMSAAAGTSGLRWSFNPRRALGRTGFVATRLGIGDVADRAVPIEQCVATVQRALEAGLNLIDTAPNYEDGFSEEIVGRALKGRRDNVFVITKIDHHDDPVTPQVEGSLKRLQMDHVDLFVFHGLSTVEGWRRVNAPGGSMDQLASCVRAGKARFMGISSHHPDVLRLAILSGRCDVVLFPVGPFVDERYINDILPLTRQHNVGSVCFKTFGAGKLVGNTTGYNSPLVERPRGKISSGGSEPLAGEMDHVRPRLTPEQCVRYTLTVDPDVALLGMSFPNEQDAAFDSATNFTPMSPREMHDLKLAAVKAVRDKGPCWWNPDSRNPSEIAAEQA